MRIGICGHFGADKVFLDGQTVKTKNVYDVLCEAYGAENVLINDTYKIKARIILVFVRTILLFFRCDAIIMLPAHNGVRVFSPLFCVLKKIFGKRIFYSVIGGWLPKTVQSDSFLKRSLTQFDGIFVETNTMKSALTNLGFNNIKVIPNFKKLSVLSNEEITYNTSAPLKLCTFSRVMKQKGIQEAVYAVNEANDLLGRTAFSLDIYGQIDKNEEDWFEELKKSFTLCVRYCGSVPFGDSVSVLKGYYALLFPTLFYTEGIPGTIIDAYAAGLPVISSRWESFSDIVDENSTGVGYDFGDTKGLVDILLSIAQEPCVINDMKKNCLKKANSFLPKNSIELMTTYLND